MHETKNKKEGSTILFCPLDWGLGHIARDLPLIKEFHKSGHRVIVAASPALIRWLKVEYPDIETTVFPGPTISYGKNGFSFLKFIFSLPGLLTWLFREKKTVGKLAERYGPSLIVSDNRYGARSSKVFSVFITHQLMIKMPRFLKWFELPVHLFLKFLINKFDECWIPDFHKDQSLAGDLVHKYKLPVNARLIGPLSRFKSEAAEVDCHKDKEDVLAIISGPEPQRTLLEQQLVKKFTAMKSKLTLYNGKSGSKSLNLSNGVIIHEHSPTNIMKLEILTHNKIISRSGYSTIMDMYCLGKNCLLIPTPGQTEQEYLAGYHQKRDHRVLKQTGLTQSETGTLTFPDQSQSQKSNLIFREKLKDFFGTRIFKNPTLV